MTVTITASDIRPLVRADDSALELANLEFYVDACTEYVEEYAPNASDRRHNLALKVFVGQLYDMPNASRNTGFSTAFRSSGAGDILADYHVIKTQIVGE